MQHGQLITQQHGPLHPEVPSPPLGGEGGGRSDRNIQVSNPHTCNKTKRFCSPGQRCVYLMPLILIPTLRVLGSPSVSFLICINYGAGSTEQMNWCYFHWRARFIKIKFKSIQKRSSIGGNSALLLSFCLVASGSPLSWGPWKAQPPRRLGNFNEFAAQRLQFAF